MNQKQTGRLARILQENEKALLDDWVKEQMSAITSRPDLMDERTLRNESEKFIRFFQTAIQSGEVSDITSKPWEAVRELLVKVSRNRTELGFSPSEIATFVFSLKQPLNKHFQAILKDDPDQVISEIWTVTVILDKLGLFTAEVYIKHREDMIRRQQKEIMELSTPVIQLWEGILAVPLIGTLDSARTQMVMENLLQAIVETNSTIAIIDITGVPAVDTLVAQHLIKTASAAGLMGAECYISGIRPQIAQAIVSMGLELGGIPTKASLSSAFFMALGRLGLAVRKSSAGL